MQPQGYIKGTYPPTPPLGLQYDSRIQKLIDRNADLADAFDDIIYDTFRFKAGQAVSAGAPARAFQVPVSGNQAVFNAGTEVYQKTDNDTNIVGAGGMLPRGQYFMAESMQCLVEFPGETDTTYPTSGPGTEEPTDVTPAATFSATNFITALLFQCHLKLRIGDKDYENGPAIYFPSDFGVSGFSGSSGTLAAAANTSSNTIVNNGFGRARRFLMEHEIPELVNFYVEMKFLQALTIPRQFNLRILLHGVRYRPLQ